LNFYAFSKVTKLMEHSSTEFQAEYKNKRFEQEPRRREKDMKFISDFRSYGSPTKIL